MEQNQEPLEMDFDEEFDVATVVVMTDSDTTEDLPVPLDNTGGVGGNNGDSCGGDGSVNNGGGGADGGNEPADQFQSFQYGITAAQKSLHVVQENEEKVNVVQLAIKPVPDRTKKRPIKKVPDEAKDAKYWATRRKNAAATRLSRLSGANRDRLAKSRREFLLNACEELEAKIEQLENDALCELNGVYMLDHNYCRY